jgi:hypothetical protein
LDVTRHRALRRLKGMCHDAKRQVVCTQKMEEMVERKVVIS